MITYFILSHALRTRTYLHRDCVLPVAKRVVVLSIVGELSETADQLTAKLLININTQYQPIGDTL